MAISGHESHSALLCPYCVASHAKGRDPHLGSAPAAPAVALSATWGDAALRLPAIHLVFGLAKRWLLGTHHGAVGKKHLPAYLDEFVFRFNRRTAKSISHRLTVMES